LVKKGKRGTERSGGIGFKGKVPIVGNRDLSIKDKGTATVSWEGGRKGRVKRQFQRRLTS